MDVKVGDTVYHVPGRRHGVGRDAYVVAVGRKWVSCSFSPERKHVAFRFDKSDGRVDGGQYTSTAKIYASREEYEAVAMLSKTWADARFIVSRHLGPPPAGVTVERIHEAMTLLGFDMTGRVEL